MVIKESSARLIYADLNCINFCCFSIQKREKYRLTQINYRACKILTEKQRESLPLEIKDDVMKKWELEDRKRKFQAMTPEERRAYLAQERKAKRQNDFPKKEDKFEDLHLPRTVAKYVHFYLGKTESLE